MFSTLLPLAMINQMVYAIPLVAVISLVYAATRHEQAEHILPHAGRLAVSITVFMGIIFAILLVISNYVI